MIRKTPIAGGERGGGSERGDSSSLSAQILNQLGDRGRETESNEGGKSTGGKRRESRKWDTRAAVARRNSY